MNNLQMSSLPISPIAQAYEAYVKQASNPHPDLVAYVKRGCRDIPGSDPHHYSRILRRELLR